MGRKRNNQNLLINDLEIDENLLTDDENQPAEKLNLRSRQGKKKKKATINNKVMKDANLIDISDFETASSTLSDQFDETSSNNDDNDKNSKEFNLLADFVNKNRDSETDDFKRNLDLNLKKKKRIFLSNDRTDFLNFILSEQQKIKKSSPFDLFLNSTNSKCNNSHNNFRLTNLASSNQKSNHNLTNPTINHHYSDDEDVNSEFNLLLNHEPNSDTAGELADDEDDGLNYLDYLNHNSTKRKFKRLYSSFLNLFTFRPHAKQSNNLNDYLLNRINQKPQTDLKVSPNLVNHSHNLTDDLDDLYLETNFVHNQTSFLGKLRDSFLNLTYFLNSNKRQSNKINYFKNKRRSERIELLSESNSDKDDLLEDGWFDGQKHVNVRLLKNKLQIQHESVFFIMVQVFIPFLFSGFGCVFAGLVLDIVQVNCL